ncbi:diguanylate cyclase, partial [Acinetobacter baumannii]
TQMRIACYLDLDNFKPFNDKYGFRAGDRALLMFSELLKMLQVGNDIFVGHVGGDDFFVGGTGQTADLLLPRLAHLQATFARDAETLYS